MIKKQCDFCQKTIEGYSQKQIKYLLLQHTLSKHQEKIRIKKEETEEIKCDSKQH